MEEDGWISVRWAFRLRWCDHIRALSAFLRCSEKSPFYIGGGGGGLIGHPAQQLCVDFSLNVMRLKGGNYLFFAACGFYGVSTAH